MESVVGLCDSGFACRGLQGVIQSDMRGPGMITAYYFQSGNTLLCMKYVLVKIGFKLIWGS